MSSSTTTPLARVHSVVVPTADQDRALAFYRDRLGLEVVADVAYGEGIPGRWIELALPGGGTTIAIGPAGMHPTGVPTGIGFASADVRATHAELAARGVDVDDVMPPMGEAPSLFFFRDADGNTLFAAERA